MQALSSLRPLAIPLASNKNIASFHDSTRSIFAAGASYMSALEKKTAGIVDYAFGALSGVFFLGSMASIISKSRELSTGPSDLLRKKNWTHFGSQQVKIELARDTSSACSSAIYVVNALRNTKWLNGRLWGYNTLNCLAAGFSMLSSGCEIVVQLRAISLINTHLERRNSSMKVDSLNEHKKNSLLTIATSLTNIAISILFCAALYVGGPLLIGVSVAAVVLTLPLQFEALRGQLALAMKRERHGSCCKIFV